MIVCQNRECTVYCAPWAPPPAHNELAQVHSYGNNFAHQWSAANMKEVGMTLAMYVPLLCREAIVAPFVGRHWLSPLLAVLCFTFVQFKILSWGLSPTSPNFIVYGTQWMQLKTVVSSQLVSICCFKHHYGVSVMFSSYIAVSKVPN